MFSTGYKTLLAKYLLHPKDHFQTAISLSCAFSIILVLFRIFYTGEMMFLFLVWNLFLAYLPYVLSAYIHKSTLFTGRAIQWLMMMIWLLLIPNAFYILTDLFHLREGRVVPLWYDLALIVSFAWNGLVMGIVSVRHVEKIVVERWKLTNEYIFIIPVMFLNAFGIYIGRYLRFNSWDVLMNPLQLIQDLAYLVMHPVINRFDWSMIICFTMMLSLFYLTLKGLSKKISK